MTRPKKTSRVTKPSIPVDGEFRRRQHGDHFHNERWCATHRQWEPAD